MLKQQVAMRSAFTFVILFAVAMAPQFVYGQFGGVVVDAEGVLQLKSSVDQTGRLRKEQQAAARAALNVDSARPSAMRFISLKQLEKKIRDNQGALTDEMRCLGGLLRVRYVFCYPESGDIVLAGPAEGWMIDGAGRAVGIASGRPVVRLEDLCVALRAFPAGGQPARLIGCSIDPTAEGLAAMQRFLRSQGSNATPADTQFIVNALQTNLGPQTVSVNGISPKTHFALTMVEADYRMKLIGIGLERPPVKLVSWAERANAAAISRNSLVRWFFTPDYDCVRTDLDGLAMELVGDGVKVVGADELVANNGQRKAAASKGGSASQAFVHNFTRVYPELADRAPVFAELRNVIDLAVASAYIQQQDLYGKSHWKPEILTDESAIPCEVNNAPKQVASAVNAIWKGHTLLTPIGGGVEIRPTQAVAAAQHLSAKDDHVAKGYAKNKLEVGKDKWWWD